MLRIISAAAAGCLAMAATSAQWKQRTIYQLLTDRFNGPVDGPCDNLGDYCGGSFNGIIEQLPYIQSMGFDAIWISPVPQNAPGGYHGFWQTQMYAVNENFGTSSELTQLAAELHAAGMYFMVGVVGNHQAPTSDPSSYFPFNSWEYFHDCSICPNGESSTFLSRVPPCGCMSTCSNLTFRHCILTHFPCCRLQCPELHGPCDDGALQACVAPGPQSDEPCCCAWCVLLRRPYARPIMHLATPLL